MEHLDLKESFLCSTKNGKLVPYPWISNQRDNFIKYFKSANQNFKNAYITAATNLLWALNISFPMLKTEPNSASLNTGVYPSVPLAQVLSTIFLRLHFTQLRTTHPGLCWYHCMFITDSCGLFHSLNLSCLQSGLLMLPTNSRFPKELQTFRVWSN